MSMRCFFKVGGYIERIEALKSTTLREAVEEAQALLVNGPGKFAEYEIWEGGKRLYSYPLDSRMSADL